MARFPRCLVLTGPTAVGKTALLGGLAESLGTDIEVISADAFQVYRGLDIGTAKPDAQLLSRVPHHLIDILEPDQQFSVADFVRETLRLIEEVRSRSALPVVCGGTIYYLKHLLLGMPESPPSSNAIRTQLEERLLLEGPLSLHEELQRHDPESAARIHLHDTYRVVRALEVWQATGRPLSSFRRETKDANPDFLVLGLVRDRSELLRNIELRVDSMMNNGLMAEHAALRALGYGKDDPGMRAIAYQEVFDFAELLNAPNLSSLDSALLEDLSQLIKIHTRQYAKRQLTFLKSLPGIQWIPVAKPDDALAEIARLVGESGGDLLT